MHKKAAMLEDRGVLSVSGADAATFLQGLLTNDVERLQPTEARYAALLTPQGKILFDMIVVRAAGGEEPRIKLYADTDGHVGRIEDTILSHAVVFVALPLATSARPSAAIHSGPSR